MNGTCEADWAAVTGFCKRNHGWLPSYGIHPWQVDSATPIFHRSLEKTLSENPSAGIGETGLDLWKNKETFALQLRIFEIHVRIAAEQNRPLSIHCLRAWEPLRNLLRNLPLPKCGFLLHAYGGPPEWIPEFCDLGARFSFSATFLSKGKEAKCTAFLKVPRDRILLESDAPSMLPQVEHRLWTVPGAAGNNQPNHPANIQSACLGLGGILELAPQELATLTTINAERLFQIPTR